MDREQENYSQQSTKILVLFIVFVVAFLIFLLSIFKTDLSDRDLPSHTATISDRAIRGSIISKDNFTITKSQKIYEVSIRAQSINPDNKALFLSLFSIYSDIPLKDVKEKFKTRDGSTIKNGTIILSKDMDAKHAAQLKSLSAKLRNLNILKPIKKENGVEILYGLDVVEIGENRVYPLQDTLAPLLGFVGKEIDKEYIRPIGKQGLEKEYNEYIKFKQNGLIEGKRDVVGDVIHNGNSIVEQRVDGMNLHLTIPLKLQRNVELMLDNMKAQTNADEILATVVDSTNGNVMIMASSNRYNPNKITKNDINFLNPKFSEYLYEPGSVLKPITLAIALKHKTVTPETMFNLNNGELDIGGRKPITDDEKFAALSATDIIVHSSNVGISLISWTLSGKEFFDGLLSFGLAQKSGIDLPIDLRGSIKSAKTFDQKLYRANSAYGYGLMASLTQLVKAYIPFNNDGIMVTPHIIDYLEGYNGQTYKLKNKNQKVKILDIATADEMKQILIKTVDAGTGVQAKSLGLTVGGKTGTSQMLNKEGKYVEGAYRSSFLGFVDDNQGHKYTFGILVINPNRPFPYYFASATAVPVAKKIIDMLVMFGYLKPDSTALMAAQTADINNTQALPYVH